ncbi:MAG TPA: TauD/TfdA family dioxygenase, partial [Pseudomonadales bacterium]|nr:TauD/TfdA family dioxygenase [Pseudomonadales bacterium]
RLATPIAWQAGDILMLDNTRFMHGRNPIGDPQHRRIYTQFGYSAFLPQHHGELAAQPWRHGGGDADVFAQPRP